MRYFTHTIFPNRESAIRLIGALLMEIDEAWTTGHKYLDMKDYLVWREEQQKRANQGSKISEIS
ncbi:transposase mutator type [Alicyclobacillus hesperidum URH17-3-68]|nr:transposase mutator type [Alicyclobacillus hesperidum URH17-3-68]GLG00223.1 hypothetical protein Alches_02620 [Alicyclobacillus hesperidum subsp. aegles]